MEISAQLKQISPLRMGRARRDTESGGDLMHSFRRVYFGKRKLRATEA